MTDLVDKIANAVPANWCDPLLTGDQAIFPKGERVPAWFEPMLLAIRERVRAEAATALEAAREDVWQPIETAPKDGNCLLAIETDDGYTFAVLERDKKGNWIHEGEPTYRHGYYFNPTHWRPLPAPPVENGVEE